MPLPDQTGRQRLNVLSLSFQSSVAKLVNTKFENQFTVFDASWHKWSTDQGHEMVKLEG